MLMNTNRVYTCITEVIPNYVSMCDRQKSTHIRFWHSVWATAPSSVYNWKHYAKISGVYLLKYDIDQTSEQRKTLPNVMEDEGQVEVDGLPLISRWTFLTLKWRLILVTHNEEICYHKMALLSIQFIINMFWKLSFLTLTKNRWLLYLCLSFAWVLGTLPEFFMAFRIFNYLAS